MMQKLVWKDIKGYEGIYQISNTGIVKSVERKQKRENTTVTYQEKIRSVYINSMGYPCVTLCKNMKSKAYTIHRLLAEAFIPNPDNKPCVDHINTITTDNRLENLRWVTHKENTRNSITYKKLKAQLKNEKFIKDSVITRKKRYGKILDIYQFCKDGTFVAKYDSACQAQKETGINYQTIIKTCRGEYRSAGGFYWSYNKEFNMREKNYHGFKVKQTNKASGEVSVFSSLRVAAKSNNCSIEKIKRQIEKPFDSDPYLFELLKE